MGKKIVYTEDERNFDSKNELNHYIYLRDLEGVKIIDDHKTFTLFESFNWYDIEQNKVRKYRDFHYTPDLILEVDGIDKPIALEVKGYARPDYLLRKKMFIMLYGKDYYFIESNSVKKMKKIIDKILKRGD